MLFVGECARNVQFYLGRVYRGVGQVQILGILDQVFIIIWWCGSHLIKGAWPLQPNVLAFFRHEPLPNSLFKKKFTQTFKRGHFVHHQAVSFLGWELLKQHMSVILVQASWDMFQAAFATWTRFELKTAFATRPRFQIMIWRHSQNRVKVGIGRNCGRFQLIAFFSHSHSTYHSLKFGIEYLHERFIII